MTKKKRPRTKHIPQRTCVVCRKKHNKRRLTRIVRTVDEGVVVDPTGKRNGRGAYLCDQQSCWRTIESDGRLLSVALGEEISADQRSAIAARKPLKDEPSR